MEIGNWEEKNHDYPWKVWIERFKLEVNEIQ